MKINYTEEDIDEVVEKIIERLRNIERYAIYCDRCEKKIILSKEEPYCICAGCTYDIDFKKIKKIVKKEKVK